MIFALKKTAMPVRKYNWPQLKENYFANPEISEVKRYFLNKGWDEGELKSGNYFKNTRGWYKERSLLYQDKKKQKALEAIKESYTLRCEDDFKFDLALKLLKDGYKVQVEVITPFGRIDILAEKEEDIKVIECKKDSSLTSVSSAIGQLSFYSKSYPGAKLYFASPKEPKDEVKEVLRDNKIYYYS